MSALDPSQILGQLRPVVDCCYLGMERDLSTVQTALFDAITRLSDARHALAATKPRSEAEMQLLVRLADRLNDTIRYADNVHDEVEHWISYRSWKTYPGKEVSDALER